jgi:hypothetical protein
MLILDRERAVERIVARAATSQTKARNPGVGVRGRKTARTGG